MEMNYLELKPGMKCIFRGKTVEIVRKAKTGDPGTNGPLLPEHVRDYLFMVKESGTDGDGELWCMSQMDGLTFK